MNKLYLKKNPTPNAHFSYPDKIFNQLYKASIMHRKFKLRLNTPKEKDTSSTFTVILMFL